MRAPDCERRSRRERVTWGLRDKIVATACSGPGGYLRIGNYRVDTVDAVVGGRVRSNRASAERPEGTDFFRLDKGAFPDQDSAGNFGARVRHAFGLSDHARHQAGKVGVGFVEVMLRGPFLADHVAG